jgi:hypothetical protein
LERDGFGAGDEVAAFVGGGGVDGEAVVVEGGLGDGNGGGGVVGDEELGEFERGGGGDGGFVGGSAFDEGAEGGEVAVARGFAEEAGGPVEAGEVGVGEGELGERVGEVGTEELLVELDGAEGW